MISINIKRSLLSFIIASLLTTLSFAQDKGSFTGGFQTSANFFLRDSLIGAANIPQYDNELFGAQSWLDLGYNIQGFDFGLRFDMFNNSNLLNPNDSYTDEGIGRWHIAKKINKLDLRVGYIYDQIGSGIIFKAYEQRPLLIDNALYGARVMYDLSDNWTVKAFTGRQKFLFSEYGSVTKGASIEGFIDLSQEGKIFTLAPGIGIVNNTQDEESINSVVDIVKNYQPVDRIEPEYNTFAYSIFNTLSLGPISLYTEYALKSDDTFFDPNALKSETDGSQTFGKLVKEHGSVFYSSLSYAAHGLGVTLEYKRTENFDYRVNPHVRLLRGQINFIPPMNRQNTYRLNARYSPATQLLSEQAYQIDVKYRWNKSLTTGVNYSSIEDLGGNRLYEELFTEVMYKYKRKWQVKTGVQFQKYNQEIYEVKPGVALLEDVIPYIDFLYKFSRKKSLRTEIQYLTVGTDEKAGALQDYGDWFFVLFEYAMAPHWSFVVSDMYNVNPGKNSPISENGEKESLHYPRIDIYYTHKANRFSLSYIKQVEGIVCNGGICRLEPAFSGFNFTINSTF